MKKAIMVVDGTLRAWNRKQTCLKNYYFFRICFRAALPCLFVIEITTPTKTREKN